MVKLPDVTYYGYITSSGRKCAELLVTRRDGRTSQQPTGVTYPNWRTAAAAVGEKNAAGGARLG